MVARAAKLEETMSARTRDQAMDDTARRHQGAFFTPAIWVDEAHREIEKALGTTWRQDSVVWDPAAGTGNLTRDYTWSSLISSTLEPDDAALLVERGWSGRAFCYDYLNPGPLPSDVDATLRQAALDKKRLVFFLNPPYAAAGNAGTGGTSKKGVADTAVRKDMHAASLGRPSRQLYAQFMFRSQQLAEQYGFEKVTVALFCQTGFMCSGSYRKFRDWWYERFAFKGGFMFQASHFEGVSGRWGVGFTVWSEGTTDSTKGLVVRLCDVEA